MHHFEAVGVQGFDEVFAAGVGLGVEEEAVVHSHFGVQRVGHADPGDDAFDLDGVAAGGAAFGVGDEGGEHFGDGAVGILIGAGAFDDVAVFQAHFIAREQSEKAFGRRFFIVGALNPDFFAY